MPGRDRGKRNKHGGRSGGHRRYIANAEELEKRQREEGGEDGDSEEEDESEEEESGDEDQPVNDTSGSAENVFVFRPKAERDAMRKAEMEEAAGGGGKSAAKTNNPNHAKKGSSGIKVKDLDDEPIDPTAGMTRKEREAMEAAKQKEEYMKKHLAGETEQARKDMERLAIVRKRREEQAAKRAVTGRKPGMSKNGLDNDDGESSEEEAPAVLSEAQAAKKAAALAVVDDSAESTNSLEIIKPIDIKKMNGDALKEALKARGLGTQGSKKDLISRLTDHEKQRAENK